MEVDVVKIACVAALAIVASRSPIATEFGQWSYGRALTVWRTLSNLISDPPTTAFVMGLFAFGGALEAGASGLAAFMVDALVAILYSVARRLQKPSDPPPGHGQVASYASSFQIDKVAPPQNLTENEAHALLDESDTRN